MKGILAKTVQLTFTIIETLEKDVKYVKSYITSIMSFWCFYCEL